MQTVDNEDIAVLYLIIFVLHFVKFLLNLSFHLLYSKIKLFI